MKNQFKRAFGAIAIITMIGFAGAAQAGNGGGGSKPPKVSTGTMVIKNCTVSCSIKGNTITIKIIK